jgi:hypothetical protein
MAIIAKFTRTLPTPTATISGGFVFLLSAGWFTQANTGVAGSPIDGGTNSIVNGGGDMQIFSDTGTTTRLPIEVVTFVTGGSPQCQVWVRTPSYTAGDTITIGKDDTQTTQPAVGAAFGRNATWVDFELVIHGATVTDSTGNHTPTLNGSPLTTAILNGSGYILDDTTKYISVPYVVALDIEKNYSIEMWIERVGAFSGRDYVSTIDPSNNTGFRFLSGGTDNIRTRQPNLSPANLTGADAINGAKRIGSNYDGTTRSNALNGAIVNSDTPTGTVTNSGEPVWIGNSQANQSMEGVLGDFFLRKAGISSDLRGSEYTNQNDPDSFGTSSEYILVGGSGISIAVTEVLNSFVDTSNINIDYNVNATVTETLNSFGDTSVISVTSGQVVNLSVTETLNSFTDISTVDVSANIDLIVTEVLNSFLDGSNVTIAKELTLQVTEVFNSFADNSSVRLPANWNDKPKVTTSYTTQTPVSTIWIDKG